MARRLQILAAHGPGDLADIDVPARIQIEAVEREELPRPLAAERRAGSYSPALL